MGPDQEKIDFTSSANQFTKKILKMTYSADEIATFLAEFHQSDLPLYKFCREKGISDGAMRYWLKGDLPTRRRSTGNPKPKYQEIEDELSRWVNERRDNGTAVWRKDIVRYAKQLAAASGQENFVISDCWVTNFMSKNEFVYRARTKTSRRIELTDEDVVSLQNRTPFFTNLQYILFLLKSRLRRLNSWEN